MNSIPKKGSYARNLEDLKEWWRKRLKYLTLTQYLNLFKIAEEKKPKVQKERFCFFS